MEIFRDKVCIVTGGASGIGRAMAARLARAGAIVVIADLKGAEEAAAALGATVQGVETDVTRPEEVQRLVDGAVSRHGRIDYLFNNAGIGMVGEIRDSTLAQWRKVIEVNLFGVIHGVLAAFPVMIKQGHGHIVNTASGFGMTPGATFGSYVASKFAVVGLSEVLRIEGAALGVKVSVICPGFVRTPMVENPSVSNASAKEAVKSIPMKLIEPETAAELALAGVAKGKAIVAFPRYVWVFVWLYRLCPAFFSRFSAKSLGEFRRLRKA